MARILVFQHVAAEPLGTLDAIIRARGHRIRFVNFNRDPQARPNIERYDGLIVLGGGMNVGDEARFPHLRTELAAIEQAIALDKPVLGICLGAQLLARVLGAPVYRHHTSEIGWYSLAPTPAAARDPVLKPLSGPRPVFQWHSYTFDLPRDAVLLATGADCPMQAFRYGESAYGFQFHLEMDEPLIRRWLSEPSYLADLEACGTPQNPDSIAAETAAHIEGLKTLADQVFNRLLDRIGAMRPRRSLPSR